jgi:prepilin-type N-terminal cleavage/methylation domain-containing protein
MTPRNPRSGVTLIELLIAVTLMGLLAAGMLMAMRIGMDAMNKSDARLMSNRKVTSVERILEQQVAGIMPVTAECQGAPDQPRTAIAFFQGEPQSMRFASTFSLHEGARGLPMILEYQVIPGENGVGVRLVVNERIYTGARGAGATCTGMQTDAFGVPAPHFLPIQVGSGSFVLADKLAYCRFSFRELAPQATPPPPPKWYTVWTKPVLPDAIRIEMSPLDPAPARLQLVPLTIPVRVTRRPLEPYIND